MVAHMKTHTVRAERHGAWWLLTVPEVPGVVSQVKSLAQADSYAREAIAFVLKTEPDSFNLMIDPQLPESLAAEATAVKLATRRAEEEQANAAAAARALARRLKALGLSGRDAATVLGISQQRFSQLLADNGRLAG